jgi:hypothetical protein
MSKKLSQIKVCLFVLLLLLSACSTSDKERIIGKFQSEQDWFLFKEDKTYDSGKDALTMVRGFKYSIDEQKKELTLYTDDSNTTYYLVYAFKGNDTLAVRNAMSTNTTNIHFIRVRNTEEKDN